MQYKEKKRVNMGKPGKQLQTFLGCSSVRRMAGDTQIHLFSGSVVAKVDGQG